MNEEQLRKALNVELAGFFGSLNKRIDTLEQKLDSKADGERVYHSLDGIIQQLDTDTIERAAVNNQLTRHENWIGQLADSTHTKLVPEQ